MAGQILLISCLLAICLPIFFVQLPRFATVKELHAETEAEARSAVLRRWPLSPSRTWQILRWIARPWSETSLDIANAESEQEQSSCGKITQSSGGRRWYTGALSPIFQGDACADGGCSSKEDDEPRKARAGKRPWDLPLRRQHPRTEVTRKSAGGRWHTVIDASLPRKTGRDLEARGLAKKLFPSDPMPEMDDGSNYDRYSVTSSQTVQVPQELLHRRPPSNNRTQSHDNEAGPSRGQHSKPLQTSGIPSERSSPDFLPSPLDGSPLPSTCYQPRSAPPAKTKELTRCSCRHCEHRLSESSVPQSPSVELVASKEPLLVGESPLYNECLCICHCHAIKSSPSSKGEEIRIPCKYYDPCSVAAPPKSLPLQCPQDDTTPATQELPKPTDQGKPKDTTKAPPKEGAKASGKEPKIGMPLWQVLLVTMGFIIFVFVFAVLVAHSLAWFLVYKTEARLGEARAGLLRGGEMKLCLCGRG